MATRATRKVFDDYLCAAKCKAQSEAHEAVASVVAASKLVSDQVYMIWKGSTPKDSKMNPTFNTDKPQSFQTPNALENISQILKEPNNFSRFNLSTQVGKDNIEDSGEITFHRLSTSMVNAVNIYLISRSSGYFVGVKSHEIASDTVNNGRRR